MKKLGFTLLKNNYIFSHTHYLSTLLCLPALHRNIERKKSDPDHCEALQGMFGMLTRWTQSCMTTMHESCWDDKQLDFVPFATLI